MNEAPGRGPKGSEGRFLNSRTARQELEEAEKRAAEETAAAASQPEIKSLLVLNGGIEIPSTWPRPNAWHRFWQWVLLGWSWEEAHGDRDS